MSDPTRLPPYAAGRTATAACLGSLPSSSALEWRWLIPVLSCVLAAVLWAAGLPPFWAGAVACGLLCLWSAGGSLYVRGCRCRSRAAGFSVIIVCPENARLLCRLCRRMGLRVNWRPHALAVHVDDRWRPPPGLSPKEAAEAFGRQYRADYDRLLAELAGQAVLVVSSTFNRHDSAWTLRAADDGWCRPAAGPLFGAAPARHGPRKRAAAQRRMFGAVVSDRRVDRPEAWRTRVFDCMRCRLVRTHVPMASPSCEQHE